ncbi:MAG TPA: histidine kinase dimerization/phospho-acceptor domain-containing protein, partial [Gaiellaceae bacterium]|nr:histidine kinase dimerization/phospho-acceptor domain-containing protein [Gaiellaceae bacterium]
MRSLSARLVAGMIVLAALGLVVADVATSRALSSYLIGKTDATLEQAHPGVEAAVFNRGRSGNDDLGPGADSARGYYIQLRTLTNRVLGSSVIPEFSGTKTPPAPKLPATIAPPAHSDVNGDRVGYFTVGAVSGGGRYRVRVSIEHQAPNDLLVIAAPLNGVDSTLHRLFLIELLATLAVLGAIAALGLWVVRLGLRPLREIEATADAITAGDLSQRVEHTDEATEVGRLGLALNAMLERIEASDQRLRRFVADASHELRTPLAAIRAYAELFPRGADRNPDDLARTMSGITRESERMSVLVEDLLLLARLDEGRPLERERVRLDEIVSEAVEMARTLDPDRRIDLDAHEVDVLGDRDRLRQVVDNLLGNVRAHTPPRTPVHVSVSSLNGHA